MTQIQRALPWLVGLFIFVLSGIALADPGAGTGSGAAHASPRAQTIIVSQTMTDAVVPKTHTKILGRDCPVVLVHGFNGWGRDELLGYLYWGGIALDIEKLVASHSMRAFTASVGPISSNHDRACELFWQIKGGQLDYGDEHAKSVGHKRMGKTFPGLYPQWDADHPIHLIGHSMGGQTGRYLTELLARDYFHQGTNERWVLSVVSITAPHNGTTLACLVDDLLWHQAEAMISAVIALTGCGETPILNFDLDQWDLTQNASETIGDFLQRARSTMGKTRDISSWDLGIQGARELNKQIRVFPSIYYMSYSAVMTVAVTVPGIQLNVTNVRMNPILWPAAVAMNNYTGNAVPASELSAWQPNDGVVNTISMRGPDNSPVVDHAGGPLQPGVWTHMGTTRDKDHGMIVGHFQDPLIFGRWLITYYDGIFDRLAHLER